MFATGLRRLRLRGLKFVGGSAVRHYRGAYENLAMAEMRTYHAIETVGLVILHLPPARRSSIPTLDSSVLLERQSRKLRQHFFWR